MDIRCKAAMAWLVLAVVSPATVSAAEIRYVVIFDATWSEQTHPQNFPGGPHFSPPVGTPHNDNVVFWEEGGLATPGIESMAETGGTGTMTGEVNTAVGAGDAYIGAYRGGNINPSPGQTGVQFVTNASYPKFTWVSMLAPSPDWFVGTNGLDLLFHGRWRDNYVVTLYTYDAGTDSGPTYTSGNADTNPQDPITLITTPPLGTNGYAPPVGIFTFTILEVDGRPPYEDPDMDGLTNLREAELGTNPVLNDTDGDTLLDAVDNCPLDANAPQTDSDADGSGDECDNCMSIANPSQTDRDDDDEGDRCDLDDRALMFTSVTETAQSWQTDTSFTKYNLYRGDLAVLRGGGDTTQDPSATNADRFCGLGTPTVLDSFVPASGETVYYLATGSDGFTEIAPGEDGTGTSRSNEHPCL